MAQRRFGKFNCQFSTPPGQAIAEWEQRMVNGVLHLKLRVDDGEPPKKISPLP